MKVYTQQGQKRFDQVKPESINDNTQAVVSVYNGRIDGQNFPINTLDKLKFVPSTITSTSTANVYGFAFGGQTQDYYFVRRWNTYEGSVNIHLPLLSFDLNASNWSSGWNNLRDIHSTFNDFILQFESTEGTLTGCIDIDFRHGVDIVLATTDWNQKWWTRWGLFCNDILIAESGRVYPRLENLCIPFNIFVGTQNIKLELKWQTINDGAEDAVSASVGATTPCKSILEIYGASIWACNTKR